LPSHFLQNAVVDRLIGVSGCGDLSGRGDASSALSAISTTFDGAATAVSGTIDAV
jgi:hypothetical protein